MAHFGHTQMYVRGSRQRADHPPSEAITWPVTQLHRRSQPPTSRAASVGYPPPPRVLVRNPRGRRVVRVAGVVRARVHAVDRDARRHIRCAATREVTVEGLAARLGPDGHGAAVSVSASSIGVGDRAGGGIPPPGGTCRPTRRIAEISCVTVS